MSHYVTTVYIFIHISIWRILKQYIHSKYAYMMVC